MPTDIETLLPLEDLQQRILAGEPLTAEEYVKVIESLRTSRTAASTAKAKRVAKTDFDLFAEIDQALGR